MLTLKLWKRGETLASRAMRQRAIYTDYCCSSVDEKIIWRCFRLCRRSALRVSLRRNGNNVPFIRKGAVAWNHLVLLMKHTKMFAAFFRAVFLRTRTAYPKQSNEAEGIGLSKYDCSKERAAYTPAGWTVDHTVLSVHAAPVGLSAQTTTAPTPARSLPSFCETLIYI